MTSDLTNLFLIGETLIKTYPQAMNEHTDKQKDHKHLNVIENKVM